MKTEGQQEWERLFEEHLRYGKTKGWYLIGLRELDYMPYMKGLWEDFREAFKRRGVLPEPEDPHHWGILCKLAMNKGLIRAVQEEPLTHMKARKSHGRRTQILESVK